MAVILEDYDSAVRAIRGWSDLESELDLFLPRSAVFTLTFLLLPGLGFAFFLFVFFCCIWVDQWDSCRLWRAFPHAAHLQGKEAAAELTRPRVRKPRNFNEREREEKRRSSRMRFPRIIGRFAIPARAVRHYYS